MGRRSTDLLDVFRPGVQGPAPAKPSAPKRRSSSSSGRFQGFFLGPRQLVLGSSVALLLLVLSFTLGLGVGRKAGRGATAADVQSLRRETTVWVLKGRLPRVDPNTGGELTAEKVAVELQRMYRIPAERVRVAVGEDGLTVAIGPFANEKEAARFYQQQRMQALRLWSSFPFRFSKPEAVRLR